MKKLIIEESFWNIFPNAKIGIIVCTNINNSIKEENKYQELLNNAIKEAKKYIIYENFADNEIIKTWRNAYSKFKTKKGARSSIESLLKRVKNGNQINNINPLVDIYNSASLKFGLPCGAEDIEKIVGNIKLTKAEGNENFMALGTEEITLPYKDEIIYKDDLGTICRCLNWRETVRTMLTTNTSKAVLCLEVIEENKINQLNEALNWLTKEIQKKLGGECQIKILDQENYQIVIED